MPLHTRAWVQPIFSVPAKTGDVSDYQHAEESLDQVSRSCFSRLFFETPSKQWRKFAWVSTALPMPRLCTQTLSLGTGDVSPFAIVGDAYAD